MSDRRADIVAAVQRDRDRLREHDVNISVFAGRPPREPGFTAYEDDPTPIPFEPIPRERVVNFSDGPPRYQWKGTGEPVELPPGTDVAALRRRILDSINGEIVRLTILEATKDGSPPFSYMAMPGEPPASPRIYAMNYEGAPIPRPNPVLTDFVTNAD